MHTSGLGVSHPQHAQHAQQAQEHNTAAHEARNGGYVFCHWSGPLHTGLLSLELSLGVCNRFADDVGLFAQACSLGLTGGELLDF